MAYPLPSCLARLRASRRTDLRLPGALQVCVGRAGRRDLLGHRARAQLPPQRRGALPAADAARLRCGALDSGVLSFNAAHRLSALRPCASLVSATCIGPVVDKVKARAIVRPRYRALPRSAAPLFGQKGRSCKLRAEASEARGGRARRCCTRTSSPGTSSWTSRTRWPRWRTTA